MDKAHLQRMFDYTFHMHKKVWACVMKLTDEQFSRELDYSIGAIRRQCWHVMMVEKFWFSYLKDGKAQFLAEDKFPNRDSIQREWEQVEKEVREYLAKVTTEDLEKEVVHPEGEAGKHVSKVWEAIMQVVLHGVDHRAQILAMLHQMGGETVGQDFFDYVYAAKK